MRGSTPRVGIGLPVHDGEEFLEQALDSIRSQSFEDFELILSDNGSTDRTAEICRRAAAEDRRVRYHRAEQNRGAAWNFNRVFALARGEYFKWAACDDLLAPDYLERCVAVLDADPAVVLCHSRVKVIDARGDVVHAFGPRLTRAGSERPADRYADVLLTSHWCFDIFGVVRAGALRATRLLGAYDAADRVLLLELALRGRFHEIPDPLFLSRDHPGRSIRALPAPHLRAAWFEPALAGRRVFPQWRLLTEYRRCIGGAELDGRDRARCYATLGRWLARPEVGARLAADLVIAAAPRALPHFVGAWRAIASGSAGRPRWWTAAYGSEDENSP